MSREKEFRGIHRIHRRDTIEVSGPDVDGEYRITLNEYNDDYSYVYLSRATLAEIQAFIDELLAEEEVA